MTEVGGVRCKRGTERWIRDGDFTIKVLTCARKTCAHRICFPFFILFGYSISLIGCRSVARLLGASMVPRLTLYHGTLFATYGLSVKSVLPTNYRSVKTFTDGPRTSLQAVSVKLLPTDRCFTDLSSVAKREVLPTLHHLVIIVLPTL